MQHSGKILTLILIVVIFIAAGLGYTEYSRELHADSSANQAALSEVEPAGSNGDTHHHTAHAAQANPKEVALTKTDARELAIRPDDLVIGDKAARIKVVEYASLSCPHCADFYVKEIPKLKAEFIDSGKVVLVYRHFPLNAPAMKAAMIVQCAPKEHREHLVHAFYKHQREWAFDANYISNIAKIAAPHGMDAKAVDACFANTPQEDAILASLQSAAKKLAIASTPTFFVNEKRVMGNATFETLSAAIKTTR